MKICKGNNISLVGDLIEDIYDSHFKKYFKPNIPDLNAISDSPVLYKLLKTFVSSKEYKLQSQTLGLIIRCFKQRQEFLIAVKRLFVISSQDDKLLLR